MKNTTSAGGVVLHPDGRVLVVNQRSTSWSLPKGHIDPGEDALGAATREIHEESGLLQITFVKKLGEYSRFKIGLDGTDDTSELKHLIFFLFTAQETGLKPIDPHNPEARWVDRKEVAPLLTHPKDRAFFESVLPILPDA